MGNKHMNVMKNNNKKYRNTVSSNIINPKIIKDKEIDSYKISKSPQVGFKMNPKFSFGDGEEGSTRDCFKIVTEEDKGEFKNKKICRNLEKNITYQLIRVIGKGFYSKVYLAEVILNNENNKSLKKGPHEIGQKLAVKVIKKKNIQSSNNPRTVQKILNEKKILQKLSNENIRNEFVINFLDAFQDEKNLYFIFPYFEDDLFSFLKHSRQLKLLNENIIKFILAQLYLVISYLHDNKIVYRDLKPENVVIDIKTGYIVLIDFGLSVSEVGNNSDIFELCGTYEYIPPEVIRGEAYNFSFDWWGFGIFFYEMIYGHPPFTGENQADIFKKILNCEILTENNGISDEAKDLIYGLLNIEKENRIKPELIRFHPFFKDIDFDALNERKISSPLLNIIKDKYVGYKYFVYMSHPFRKKQIDAINLKHDNSKELNINSENNSQEPKVIVINQDLFKDF